MIFFSDAHGTLTACVPTPLHQGSNLANDIILIAPFPESAVVSVFFKLPNGVLLEPSLAEDLKMTELPNFAGVLFNNEGVGLSAWRLKLGPAITRYSGDLSVQFAITWGSTPVGNTSVAPTVTTDTVMINVGTGISYIQPSIDQASWDVIVQAIALARQASENAEDYADRAETAERNAADILIDALKYRGSVLRYLMLPADASNGDVYSISEPYYDVTSKVYYPAGAMFAYVFPTASSRRMWMPLYANTYWTDGAHVITDASDLTSEYFASLSGRVIVAGITIAETSTLPVINVPASVTELIFKECDIFSSFRAANGAGIRTSIRGFKYTGGTVYAPLIGVPTLRYFSGVDDCSGNIELENCSDIRGCTFFKATGCRGIVNSTVDLSDPRSYQDDYYSLSTCSLISNLNTVGSRPTGDAKARIYATTCRGIDAYTCDGYTLDKNTSIDTIPVKSPSIFNTVADVYTVEGANQLFALKSDLGRVFNFKGTVENYSDLPTDAVENDVYRVINDDTPYNAGLYAWTGSEWSYLGNIDDVSEKIVELEERVKMLEEDTSSTEWDHVIETYEDFFRFFSAGNSISGTVLVKGVSGFTYLSSYTIPATVSHIKFLGCEFDTGEGGEPFIIRGSKSTIIEGISVTNLDTDHEHVIILDFFGGVRDCHGPLDLERCDHVYNCTILRAYTCTDISNVTLYTTPLTGSVSERVNAGFYSCSLITNVLIDEEEGAADGDTAIEFSSCTNISNVHLAGNVQETITYSNCRFVDGETCEGYYTAEDAGKVPSVSLDGIKALLLPNTIAANKAWGGTLAKDSFTIPKDEYGLFVVVANECRISFQTQNSFNGTLEDRSYTGSITLILRYKQAYQDQYNNDLVREAIDIISIDTTNAQIPQFLYTQLRELNSDITITRIVGVPNIVRFAMNTKVLND